MGRVSRTSPSKGLAGDSLVESSTSLSRVVAMLFSPANVFVLFLTVKLCNIGLSSTGTGSGSSVPFVGTSVENAGSVENARLDLVVELWAISVEFILLIPTVVEISVESTDPTPPVRVPGICKLPPLTPATIGLDISVGNGVESCEIISVFISVLACVGILAPRGVGEFGGVMVGRSSVDPAPGVSTDPKRRFLGAVALRDRGRKLYPGPGRGAGPSEAEADPKPSGWSMDSVDQTVKLQ